MLSFEAKIWSKTLSRIESWHRRSKVRCVFIENFVDFRFRLALMNINEVELIARSFCGRRTRGRVLAMTFPTSSYVKSQRLGVALGVVHRAVAQRLRLTVSPSSCQNAPRNTCSRTTSNYSSQNECGASRFLSKIRSSDVGTAMLSLFFQERLTNLLTFFVFIARSVRK